jgi:hypothetical protein
MTRSTSKGAGAKPKQKRRTRTTKNKGEFDVFMTWLRTTYRPRSDVLRSFQEAMLLDWRYFQGIEDRATFYGQLRLLNAAKEFQKRAPTVWAAFERWKRR